MDCVWSTLNSLGICSLSPDIILKEHKLRIRSKLGEGGYSNVYLVKDIATQQEYALKQIYSGSHDELQNSKQEINVMRSLDHPYILPLVDWEVQGSLDLDGGVTKVLMLFPPCKLGSLSDAQVSPINGKKLSLQDKLLIFHAICEAVAAMHDIGLAHFDLKPHNILFTESISKGGGHNSSHGRAPPMQVIVEEENGIDDDAENVCLKDDQLAIGRQLGFVPILSDFGSARRVPITVSNRKEALKIQEGAEANSTASYRAPELFDVASPSVVSAAVDIWSLGCLLYFMVTDFSPFEYVATKTGGSLPLAVMNAKLQWPSKPRNWEDSQVREIIESCLQSQVDNRPNIKQLINRIEGFLQALGATHH